MSLRIGMSFTFCWLSLVLTAVITAFVLLTADIVTISRPLWFLLSMHTTPPRKNEASCLYCRQTTLLRLCVHLWAFQWSQCQAVNHPLIFLRTQCGQGAEDMVSALKALTSSREKRGDMSPDTDVRFKSCSAGEWAEGMRF